ncbi:RNA polymerase sigma factor [Pedobacter nyackensis]|uniref:RNA polymerase sigma-70 factor, ECF subfamily n=1 Tax=Pedobacter nyackensis TaxID=475255 RepID=A0A1W2EUZ4_9SPHI|nr:sigma-70 family RNA polymerase sigma factor [Pedobacter nyackensis]SMD13491.1 RNA polymerase sigma-70 factor, ECF subfamily [Pedobacter nyackensis]
MIEKSNDTLSVKALLIRLINHDHSSFHELYDRFSVQIYGNILRMVKDADLAQEILQEVFVKLWEKRSRIDPDKAFNSFLHQIARNMIYDHFRKLAVAKKLETHFTEINTSTYSHIEEELIYKESNQIFLNAVAQLSPQRKQVFTLCKIEGKSYNEVSDLLHISTSTVSDHLLKSSKFIKAQMLLSNLLSPVFISLSFLKALL